MSERGPENSFAPPARSFLDLWIAALGVVLAGVAVFAPVASTSVLRPVVGLLFVLFVPGYAFVAALFPERQRSSDTGDRDAGGGDVGDRDVGGGDAGGRDAGDDPGVDGERGIDWLERVVLSFGTSIAIVPLVGLVLNFTPWGIRLVPVFAALAGLTLLLVGVAAVRRQRLPAARRLRLPTASVASVRSELLDPNDSVDAALNVLLVVSVLVAASSVAFAVGAPTGGESFTEFYVLTENESGALVADDYPENLTVGEPQPLVVGVSNHEGARTNYTVVVELQRVTVDNGSVHVRNASRLHTFRTALAAGETWHHEHTITPPRAGEDLRLAYYLYTGDAPTASREPYRQLHLWVDVANATAEQATRTTEYQPL